MNLLFFIEDYMLQDKDVMLIFDVTGDSVSNLFTWKQSFKDKLFWPNCRYGLILHSNYFNRKDTYRLISPTGSRQKLGEFLKGVKFEHFVNNDLRNYEQVVYDLTNGKTQWHSTTKIVIFIGNGLAYERNFTNINLRRKLSTCFKHGIKIYTIQTGANLEIKKFYQEVTTSTNGLYLYSDLRINLPYLIKAIVSREYAEIKYPNITSLQYNLTCLRENFPNQQKHIEKHLNIFRVVSKTSLRRLRVNANITGKMYTESPKGNIFLDDQYNILVGEKARESKMGLRTFHEQSKNLEVENCEVIYEVL